MIRLWFIGCAFLAGLPALALEPRFDHRDEGGLLLETGITRDSMSPGRGISYTSYAPNLRVAYSLDVNGIGDELQLGLASRLGGWGIQTETASLSLDARWRGFFGTDEFKTFFDIGCWGPIYPVVSLGVRTGAGAEYDPSRLWGITLAMGVGIAFGQALILSIDGTIGLQIRY